MTDKLYKVLISFGQYTDANVEVVAGAILAGMKNHPKFPNPIPPLTDLQDALDNYRVSLVAAKTLDRVKVAEKNVNRTTLENLLSSLAKFVNYAAGGDYYALVATGFPMAKLPEPVEQETPEAPVLKNGKSAGQLICGLRKRPKGAVSFIHQVRVAGTGEWRSESSSRNTNVFIVTPRMDYEARIAVIGARKQIVYSPIAGIFVV